MEVTAGPGPLPAPAADITNGLWHSFPPRSEPTPGSDQSCQLCQGGVPLGEAKDTRCGRTRGAFHLPCLSSSPLPVGGRSPCP